MILQMYSVYDIKSGVFHPPHYCHNDGHAMRMFAMQFSQSDTVFKRYPKDFQIYCLGAFNDATAEVQPDAKPRLVCTVDALLSEEEQKDGKSPK